MTLKRITALLLALLMLFALAACGTQPAGQPQGGQSGEAPAGEDDGEDVYFRLAVYTDTHSLNPLLCYDWGFGLFSLMYSTLFTLDENFEPMNLLAESYTYEPDGDSGNYKFTCKIREDCFCTDGEKVTAADVVYTLGVMPESMSFYMYVDSIDMETLKAEDEYTFSFNTYGYNSELVMGFCQVPILPAHIWEPMSFDERQAYTNDMAPVCNGSYTLLEHTPSYITFERNKEWFGPTDTDIDYLVCVVYTNDDAMSTAIQSGEVDGILEIDSAFREVLDKSGSVDCQAGICFGASFLAFNMYTPECEELCGYTSTANPALKDINVRYAIDYCCDREAVVSLAFNGNAYEADTFYNTGYVWKYDVANDPYFRDSTADDALEKAAALLKEAGYTLDTDNDGILENADGVELEFRCYAGSDRTEKLRIADIIKSNCAKIGIGINIIPMDVTTMYDTCMVMDFDMYLWSMSSDPAASLMASIYDYNEANGTYAYGYGYNDSGYDSSQYTGAEWRTQDYTLDGVDVTFDELYDMQRGEEDPELKGKYLHMMQQMVYEDCPGVITDYSFDVTAIYSDRWTDYVAAGGSNCLFGNWTYINYWNMKLK